MLNHFTADQPDLAYAAKDIAWRMADPERKDLEKIARVAHYMLNPEFGRTAQGFQLMAKSSNIMVCIMTPIWAVRRETHWSTIGGAIRTTCGAAKHWSCIQKAVQPGRGGDVRPQRVRGRGTRCTEFGRRLRG